MRRYRDHGLAGLARRPRSDRGKRTFPVELVRLIEVLALRTPALSAAAIHRQVATVARAQDWPIPSYGTVYAIVRGLDPGLVTLARDGPKAYRERFDLIHRREALAPNAIWQADHTRLDAWVRDERNWPAKPWLTVIVDDTPRHDFRYAWQSHRWPVIDGRDQGFERAGARPKPGAATTRRRSTG